MLVARNVRRWRAVRAGVRLEFEGSVGVESNSSVVEVRLVPLAAGDFLNVQASESGDAAL